MAKKFGKRNVTMAGFVLYAIGGAICMIAPKNMVVVLVCQFIKNIGGLPCAYVMSALFADVLGHIEWRYDFRCDGFSASVQTIILTCTTGVVSGLFNFLLAKPVILSLFLTRLPVLLPDLHSLLPRRI